MDIVLNKLIDMAHAFIGLLPKLFISLIVLLAFYFLSKVLKRLIVKLFSKKQNLGLVLARLTRWATILLGIFIAIMIILPSFEFADFIAVLGLGSIAVGFAFKDIFQNFLAGILILLNEPFRIGDQIIVHSGDHEGIVTEIHPRATYIKKYDGRRVVIPNAKLYMDTVTVNTAFSTRRSQYELGVGYDTDLALVKNIIIKALIDIEGVIEAPAPDIKVWELADSAVILRVRWWTDSKRSEVVGAHDSVIEKLFNALNEANIDIPFPVQTVLFHDKSAPNNKSLDS